MKFYPIDELHCFTRYCNLNPSTFFLTNAILTTRQTSNDDKRRFYALETNISLREKSESIQVNAFKIFFIQQKEILTR